VPDKALSLGERVPAGTGHLGLLDAAHVAVGRRDGVPEVEVEVNHGARVNARGLHQLSATYVRFDVWVWLHPHGEHWVLQAGWAGTR
jgi:hypothetical protein